MLSGKITLGSHPDPDPVIIHLYRNGLYFLITHWYQTRGEMTNFSEEMYTSLPGQQHFYRDWSSLSAENFLNETKPAENTRSKSREREREREWMYKQEKELQRITRKIRKHTVGGWQLMHLRELY